MTGGAARALPLTRTGTLVAAYAGLLVAWGNAKTVLLEPTAALPGGSPGYVLAGAALVAVSLVAARAMGLDASALGLRRGLLPAAVGAAIGVLAAAAGVAALRTVAPLVLGHAVDYVPLANVSAAALATHVVLFLPLSVAVPEEVAFRGVLLGALVRLVRPWAAVLASACAFAAWHGALLLATVGQTTIGAASPWTPVAVANALTLLVLGGVLFAWLRLATGSLATTVAAHWTYNAVVLAGLWWTR